MTKGRDRLSLGPAEVGKTAERLVAQGGGYEVVHAAPGLEIGVYALVAPAPDTQTPHEDDELYVVLRGRGTIEIDGRSVPLEEGQAAFVPAGAEHRFTDYKELRLLVIFTPPAAEAAPLHRQPPT